MTESKYDWLGHPNSAPPNFVEITEKQFAQETKFGMYTPEHTEYRQIHGFDKDKQGREQMLPVKLFVFHDGTGCAIQVDYWGIGYYDNPKPKEPLKHLRFFSFAKCKHDMVHTERLGNCYNRYKCSKCGYTEDVDSSD